MLFRSRSILRQDPDIVMIGEMRDFETAHIGVQASLTRHLVLKVLQSAVANAEHNYGMDTDKLHVVAAFADQGPSMKRFRPASMGRAHPYVHRTSHVTVTVSER